MMTNEENDHVSPALRGSEDASKFQAVGASIGPYLKKLAHYYDSDGRLTQYPTKRPMRIIALIRITEQIDAGRRYTEKEINELIRRRIAFNDIELIRRELYQYGFLGRLRDGSEYWVEAGWRTVYADHIGGD